MNLIILILVCWAAVVSKILGYRKVYNALRVAILLGGIYILLSCNEVPKSIETQPTDPPHKIEFVSDSIYQLNMQFINSYDTIQ